MVSSIQELSSFVVTMSRYESNINDCRKKHLVTSPDSVRDGLDLWVDEVVKYNCFSSIDILHRTRLAIHKEDYTY